MKRLIKWLLLFTVVVVIGLTVILFNPLLIKTPVEQLLGKMIGYEVSLDGALQLNIGKQLSVRATDIQITNPAHKEQPNLATLGSLQIILESASLFSDALIISQISLDDALIDLDTNKSGVSNWKKPPTEAPESPPTTPAKTFNIKNIKINNSSLHYQQHELDRNQLLKVSSFIQTQGDDGLLNVDLNASLNDRPVTFDGRVGKFANIIKGRDISFEGKGQIGPIKVSGKGLIDDLIHPKQPQFDIKMIGPNIKDVTAMLKIEDLGNGPFDLEAHGQEEKGKYTASVNGKIGDITLNISALSPKAGNFDDLTIKLDAKGPNLGALARAFGQQGWPDQTFSMNGDIQRNGSKLDISPLKINIGGANFLLNAQLSDFPRFDPSAVSLSIKGDEVAHFRELLHIKGVATGAFSLQGDLGLSDKNIKQLNLSLETSLGEAQVSGELGAAPTYSDSSLHLELAGHNAHQFMSIFNVNILPEEAFTFASDIHWKATGQQKSQHVTLQQLNIKLADVELTGSVAFDTHKPLKTGSGSLKLNSKDIVNLARFPKLEKFSALFIPGQPFNLSGNLLLSDQHWDLKDLKGAIGGAALAIEGVLEPSNKWAGSSMHVNINGPGLHLLLNNIGPSSHLQEAFTSSGLLKITTDELSLTGFEFESGDANATLNGSMPWPIVPHGEIRFELNSHGQDISRFVPELGKFKPAGVAFSLKTSGKQQHSRIVIESMAATAGSLQLTLSGDLNSHTENAANRNETGKNEATASIRLKSGNISDLGRYDDRPLPDTGLTLQANVHGSLEHFQLKQLQAKLGSSDLSGTLEVLLGGLKPEFLLHSTSNLLDLRPFQPQRPPVSIAKPVKDDQRRLIPATALPLDSLKQFNATIDANIKELRLKTDSLKNIVFKARIKDGALNMPALTLNGQRGSLSSTLAITTTGPTQANVAIDLRTVGFVLDTSNHASFDADTVPPMDLVLKVHGQGGDLRQIAATASGTFKIGSAGGTLADVNLGVLDKYFLDEIFSLILPKSKQHENTKLTCAAAVFELVNGVAQTQPALAFTTNKITLVAKGSLDLSTERLSFEFKATPNNLLKVSAGEFLNSLIVVGGTLSKPEVGLDPTKVLLQSGAAIGSIGISLLAKGLIDRVGNMNPVCHSMLDDVQKTD